MRKGEHYIVVDPRGTKHPIGTEVEIIHINPSSSDKTPVLARAVGGRTEYWYETGSLAKEIDGIRVR